MSARTAPLTGVTSAARGYRRRHLLVSTHWLIAAACTSLLVVASCAGKAASAPSPRLAAADGALPRADRAPAGTAVPVAATGEPRVAVAGRARGGNLPDLTTLRQAMRSVVLIALISVQPGSGDEESGAAGTAGAHGGARSRPLHLAEGQPLSGVMPPSSDASQPGAPGASQPGAPSASQPGAPGGSQPAAPGTSPSQPLDESSAVVEQGWGAGVVIDGAGLVLTNDHLLQNAYRIEVHTADGQRLKARLVGRDPETDIALLRVTPKTPLQAAALGTSSAVRVGDWVGAVGNPFGLGQVLSLGVVGAVGRLQGRNLPDEDMIQTDAPLNPGNSGGPLFNLEGEVIGITTAAVSGAQGLGFAIPIDRIKPLLPALREHGRVQRGWLGVETQDLDASLRRYFKAPEGGALVVQVTPGSPAERAGLSRGDVVVALDGQPVRSSRELRLRAGAKPQGSRVSVRLMRGGAEKNVPVQLSGPPAPPATPQIERRPVVGIDGISLTPALAELLGLEGKHGLIVSRVELGSLAFEAGIRPGDLVLEADRQPVHTRADLTAACSRAKRAGRVIVLLVHGKEGTRYLALGQR